MFRALICSSSGGQNCIIQHLLLSHTGRPPTECDGTKCCIIQFRPPDDEQNSARNM